MRFKSLLLLLSFFTSFYTVQGHPNDNGGNCVTPAGLSAITSAGSADLSWNAVPGAVGYWVEVESEGVTPPYHIEIQIAANSYTATGLTATGNYKFKVRTKCPDDKSDWSEWYNFSTGSSGGGGSGGGSGSGSCAVPAGLSASAISGNSATLTWPVVNGATGYKVEVESENFSPVFHVEVQVGTNSFTVTGLSANVTYKFKVRTICGGGQSDWSGWVFFASAGGGGGNGGGSGACDVPGGMTVTNNTGGAPTLSWTAVNAATSYWVEVENEGQTPPFHLEVQVNTNSYIVSGLVANGLYKFKVRSVCGGGQSTWSGWVFFVAGGGNSGGGSTGGACTAPTMIMITGATGTSAIISWNAVAGAIAYNIEVENSTGNLTSFKDTATVTANTYTVNNLLPNLKYKVKVRTVCANGSKSDWTNWFTFNSSTGQITPSSNSGGCGKPKGLTASNITANSALLTWKNVPGASGYFIEVEKESGGSQHITVVAVDTFITVNGLTPGSLYKFKVRSLCSGGHSKWSSWKFFATPLLVTPGSGNKPLNTNTNTHHPITADINMTSYPNPVTDQLVVVLNDAKEGQTNHFTITSLSGMVVLEQSVKSDSGYMSKVFDLSAFNNGMYLLRWTNGQQAITKKIIVSK